MEDGGWRMEDGGAGGVFSREAKPSVVSPDGGSSGAVGELRSTEYPVLSRGAREQRGAGVGSEGVQITQCALGSAELRAVTPIVPANE
jgi:hypothetical protein